MKKLLYKEFKLAINPRFFILAPLTGALILIPQWLYFIALMYFLFISVPNIFSVFNTQNDLMFSSILPITKSDYVKSKVYVIIIMESIHLLFAVIFSTIRNQLYGTYNFFMDANITFFGIAIIMYTIFNVIFFPSYFRTGRKYGIPVILGCVGSIIFITAIELLVIFNSEFKNVVESKNVLIQITLFIISLLISIISTKVMINTTIKRFKQVEV